MPDELFALSRIIWREHRFKLVDAESERYILECSDGSGLKRELLRSEVDRLVGAREMLIEPLYFGLDGSVAKPDHPMKMLADLELDEQRHCLYVLTWLEELDKDYRAGRVKLYEGKSGVVLLKNGALPLNVWIDLNNERIQRLCRPLRILASDTPTTEPRHARPTGDLRRPSVSVLKGNYRKYRTEGFDPTQLKYNYGNCVEGGQRLAVDIEAAALEIILDIHAKEGRMLVPELQDLISARLTVDRGEFTAAPCPQTLKRLIGTLDEARAIAARFGFKKVRESHGMNSEGPRYTRIGECVYMDCWKVDIVLFLKRTGIWMHMTGSQKREWGLRRRVWACIAVDAATRVVLGLGFGLSETPELTRRVLRMAVSDKSDYVEVAGAKAPALPAIGIDALRHDTGVAFQHGWFKGPALSLIPDTKVGMVGKPWWRGVMERLNKTTKDNFLGYFTGLTFGNPVARGDYDAMGRASLDLERFGNAMFRYYNDVYALRGHRGLKGQPPLNRLVEELQETSAPDPYPKSRMGVAFGIDLMLPLTDAGLTYSGVQYRAEWLRKLYSKGTKAMRVKVDPVDLGQISVFFAGAWQTVIGPMEFQGVGLTFWKQRCAALARKFGQQVKVNFPIVAEALLSFVQLDAEARLELHLSDTSYNSKAVRDAVQGLTLQVIYRPTPEGHARHREVTRGAFGTGIKTSGAAIDEFNGNDEDLLELEQDVEASQVSHPVDDEGDEVDQSLIVPEEVSEGAPLTASPRRATRKSKKLKIGSLRDLKANNGVD